MSTGINNFMNTIYNAIGTEVSGYYKDTPFLGKIISTRAKYGNDIQVTVEDDDGRWFLIDATEILSGDTGVYTNLHVYFK
jgi:hypothetical protein